MRWQQIRQRLLVMTYMQQERPRLPSVMTTFLQSIEILYPLIPLRNYMVIRMVRMIQQKKYLELSDGIHLKMMIKGPIKL